MNRNPNMVSTANIFAGVRFSPMGLPSNTLFESIALVADVTALMVPAVNDSHVKDSSFNDANPTPPMIGTRLRYTGNGKNSLNPTASIIADQTGSVAFRMCVKEMAPAPNEMTPATCVAAKKNACELNVLTLSNDNLGALRNPDAHRNATYGNPKNSSIVAAVHGNGRAFRTLLFPMLYPMLRTYQRAKSPVSRSVRFMLPSISVASVVQYSLDSGSNGSHDPSMG
mmetsp:Transcript_32848/g.79496  ORF Transcript_32848/g.79496 Transcript_32848/m.79496 type:complete len:226 (+) Transcript_32848:524-1201(+)